MDEQTLHKRYGLPMAICMVIGIVIGSGVFFKAEKILLATNGNLKFGILSWAIGALVMIFCAYAFSLMAQKYSYVNGVIDYAQNTLGDKYAYMLAWYMTTMYTPAITGVLAWVSARYLCVIMGYSITGGECLAIAGIFIIYSFGINALAPMLSAKLQISTTIIKLIPLLLMGIVGIVVGLSNGMTVKNFTYLGDNSIAGNLHGLFTGVVASAFAYEGWILATSINQELKNSKRDLPIALFFGTITVAVIYILYYVGLSGAVDNSVLMESGEKGAKIAFQNIFGNAAGTVLMVFVVISCLGTLNGLMVSCIRSPFALASRKQGFAPKVFGSIDGITNMPVNSTILGFMFAEFWLFYFYGANLQDTWFAPFKFDSSEIPIVGLYAMYIPIFIGFIKKQKEGNEKSAFKTYVAPILGAISSAFMVYAAIISHGSAMIFFLIMFMVVMAVGYHFGRKTKVF